MAVVLRKLKKALTPKLRCDSSSSSAAAVPSSPPRTAAASVSKTTTTTSLKLSSEKLCAICLNNVDKDIFAADCSHSFHFSCILKNIEHGNLCCPICRKMWDNVPFQAAKDIGNPQQNNICRMRPHPEPLSFADDEPLLSTSPIQSSGSQTVTIKTYTETSAVAASESPPFPVLVSIRAPPLEDANGQGRAAIDLVTVLDVSGSMAGLKLDLAKQAIKFVIQNLGPSDRLSLVSFSSNATRIFPLRRMSDDGRKSAILAVESLISSSNTNIVEGIKKGTRVLEERRESNPVASIMLLSDGNDSYYTRVHDLMKQMPASICSSKTKNGIPVYTFGFGKNHCPITMNAISDASCGTFSFIESVEMIQDSFAMCIGGLLSVVTQELQLALKTATHGVKILALPSGRYFSDIFDKGKQGVITVGNMYADEEKQFLVYLSVPKSSKKATTKTSLLEVLCTYKDLAANELIRVPVEIVEILRPKFCSPEEKVVCLKVDMQSNRTFVADSIAKARRMAETGNLKGAQATLAEQKSALLESAAAKAGDSLIPVLEAQLTEVINRMASMELYTQIGRAYTLSEMSSHSLQRAAATGNTSSSLTMSGGSNSSSSTSVFETPNMTRMLKLSHNFGTNSSS